MKKAQELLTAVENGEIKKVTNLLNPKLFGIIKPVDIGITAEGGWTLLMAAVSNGHGDIARLLLEKGADVNAKTGDQFTALMTAAKFGHKDIAALLLDHGADIHAAKTGDDEGENPLMFAAWKGHTNVAELLIQREADVNAKTPNGYTAMMSAAKFGHLDMARLLFKHGADIHAAKTGDDQGWNPILFAAWQGKTEVVKWLIENGAKVDSRTADKWTPLLFATREGHEEVAEVLMEAGADINAQQKDGWTPLILAAYNGCHNIIRILLKRGADIHVVASDHLNALETALDKDFNQIAINLIEHGADVGRKQSDGSTLLHKTVAKGSYKIVSAILESGKADVNARDNHGVTPLMKAVKAGNRKMVEKLLEYKPDVNIKDKNHNTALDYAYKKNYKKVIPLLMDAGAEPAAASPLREKHEKPQEMTDIDNNGLPQIRAAVTDIYLVDSSQLGAPGTGGTYFQQAIQCHNNRDESGAAINFQKALDAGLDKLRQGYAHANIAVAKLKKGKVEKAIAQFMRVLNMGEALYESAHDAAQYLAIIYSELGRNKEAARLEQLAARTQAQLGYSLAWDAAEQVRQTVRRNKNKLLSISPAKKKKPRGKKLQTKDIKEGLRPLGNPQRLTRKSDENAHDAYLMLFNTQVSMENYYCAFLAYTAKKPPPMVLEVMTAYAPKTLFDEHYAFIYPHPATDLREEYGIWIREAILTCNEEAGSDNHTSSRYNAIGTNVEKIFQWEILIPAGFDPAAPQNAALLSDPENGGYPAVKQE